MNISVGVWDHIVKEFLKQTKNGHVTTCTVQRLMKPEKEVKIT